MDDPGKLVLAGYTAGNRAGKTGTKESDTGKKSLFNWACNVTDSSLQSDDIKSLDIDLSNIFALLWQNVKSCSLKQLQAFVEDTEAWIKEISIYQMDAKKAEDSDHLVVSNVTVRVGDRSFVMKNVELAPPYAVAGINYSRYTTYIV
jgi:hypothetical protein